MIIGALILAVLLLWFGLWFLQSLANAFFRVVVAFVKLPWYLGVAVWRGLLLGTRFKRWCESQYVAAERRAREV